MLTIIIALSESVMAFDPFENNTEYSKCMDKSEGVTYKMMNCTNIVIKKEDAILNTTYKKTMKILSDEKRKRLREDERAWIKYRDQKTLSIAKEGGTYKMLLANEYVARYTYERRLKLEYIYEDAMLNTTYQKTMKILSNEKQKRLREAEQVWMKHKDEQCTFDGVGGTLDPISARECHVRAIYERRLQLEYIYETYKNHLK